MSMPGFESLDLESDLLALDAAYYLLRRVLGDDLIVVEHLELFSGVAAHEVHDGLWPARVLVEPV